MKVEMTIRNRGSAYWADAIYDGKRVTVLPGGLISRHFASHIKGGNAAKIVRDNREYVDENGRIIKECVFNSPSTAAQFVLGTSKNGYISWRLQDGMTLGDYLKQKGIR